MSKARSKAHLFSSGTLNDEPDSLQGYYAGFASRAVAIIVDVAIISLISAVVIGALSVFFDLPSIQRFIRWLNSILPGSDQIFVELTGPRFAALFFFAFLYLYFIFFFSTTGQTVGKAVMGLRVVTTDGKRMGLRRSLIRTLCYTVSLAPLGLGFLWVLGEDRRRAWHDKIAHTYVLYVWDARYEENFLRNAVYQLTKKRAVKKTKTDTSPKRRSLASDQKGKV
jgi:uncharacterized RDD family membrane protein YckC